MISLNCNCNLIFIFNDARQCKQSHIKERLQIIIGMLTKSNGNLVIYRSVVGARLGQGWGMVGARLGLGWGMVGAKPK